MSLVCFATDSNSPRPTSMDVSSTSASDKAKVVQRRHTQPLSIFRGNASSDISGNSTGDEAVKPLTVKNSNVTYMGFEPISKELKLSVNYNSTMLNKGLESEAICNFSRANGNFRPDTSTMPYDVSEPTCVCKASVPSKGSECMTVCNSTKQYSRFEPKSSCNSTLPYNKLESTNVCNSSITMCNSTTPYKGVEPTTMCDSIMPYKGFELTTTCNSTMPNNRLESKTVYNLNMPYKRFEPKTSHESIMPYNSSTLIDCDSTSTVIALDDIDYNLEPSKSLTNERKLCNITEIYRSSDVQTTNSCPGFLLPSLHYQTCAIDDKHSITITTKPVDCRKIDYCGEAGLSKRWLQGDSDHVLCAIAGCNHSVLKIPYAIMCATEIERIKKILKITTTNNSNGIDEAHARQGTCHSDADW